jgi:hypothetical protein
MVRYFFLLLIRLSFAAFCGLPRKKHASFSRSRSARFSRVCKHPCKRDALSVAGLCRQKSLLFFGFRTNF